MLEICEDLSGFIRGIQKMLISSRLETIHNLLTKLTAEEYKELCTQVKSLFVMSNRPDEDTLKDLISIISSQRQLAKTVGKANGISSDSSEAKDVTTTTLSKPRHKYYGEIMDIRQTAVGNFGGKEITFNIYYTKGDGDCGFYSLPIPDDKDGIKDVSFR